MKTMERTELIAWLGDDWAAEQVEQIADQYGTWERANPDATEDLAEAVLTAISQRVDGVLDLDELGEADQRARETAVRTRLASHAAVLAYDVAGEIGRGKAVTEAELAQRLRVDRMTVRRRWRGLA